LRKSENPHSKKDIEYFIRESARRSTKLRARAILGAARFSFAVDHFRDILVKRGCDGRQADMFAALLAGRSLLLDDDKPREEPELFNALNTRLGNIFLEDSESGDGQLCLHHLFDATCEAIRDGRRLTIGQIVAKERQSPSTFDNVLDSYGLRLMPDGDDTTVRSALLLKNLAVLAIEAWEGIGDVDGNLAAVTPEAIKAFMDLWPMANAFEEQYLTPALLLEQEKNA
jgi:hypothetical protein